VSNLSCQDLASAWSLGAVVDAIASVSNHFCPVKSRPLGMRLAICSVSREILISVLRRRLANFLGLLFVGDFASVFE
jgi:hypothetical protein